jgi:hypothetical protein
VISTSANLKRVVDSPAKLLFAAGEVFTAFLDGFQKARPAGDRSWQCP